MADKRKHSKKRQVPGPELPQYAVKGRVYKPGDCILVNGGSDVEPFIGRITRLVQMKNDPEEVKCYVTWFYRPEEAVGGRKAFHGENEVFESDHEDVVHCQTILSHCRMHTLKQYESLESPGETDFFSRFRYKPSTHEFEPDRVPVYCTCELPYNPDRPMLMCDYCQEWYHTECLNLSEQQVEVYTSQRRPFMCTACQRNGQAQQQQQMFGQQQQFHQQQLHHQQQGQGQQRQLPPAAPVPVGLAQPGAPQGLPRFY